MVTASSSWVILGRNTPALILFLATLLCGTGSAIDAQAHSPIGFIATQWSTLSLSFEANRGQADRDVAYLHRGVGPAIQFRPREIILGDHAGHTLSLTFVNSNPAPRLEAADELLGKVNYLTGSDPSKWVRQIPTFATVKYFGIYPGIDVRFHGRRGQLEYDFDVAPGADAREIKIRFDQSAKVHSEANGDIVIERDGIRIRQHSPHAYQAHDGLLKEINSRAVINGNEIRFDLGSYDRAAKLVIDPVLVCSTYFGGSGGVDVPSSEYPAAVAMDSAGNIYLAGSAPSSDFPVTAGAFQAKKPDSPNGAAGFVAKVSADGQTLIYSTYLGGSGNDIATGIAIDSAGNAYITGISSSTDFPLVKPFQSKNNDKSGSAFVAELNATGSALVYSSYLGGTESDATAGIALDSQNDAYVSGTTTSTDFPVTSFAAQPTYGGGKSDGFVAKISASGSLSYATFLGGSFDDAGARIAVDSTGNAYITGYTASSDFPATAGVVQPSLAVGNCNSEPCHDGFVTKLSTSGSILYSTFLGGTRDDYPAAVGVDAAGEVYITGQTASTDFPMQNPFESYPGGLSVNAFVTKLSADATSLVFSTYFGTGESGYALTVDNGGNVFFAGAGYLGTVPLVQPLQSNPIDAFVSELDPTGQNLLFSTYFGGGFEVPFGVAIDNAGNVALVGETGSSYLPVYHALIDICPKGGDGRYCPDVSPDTPTGTGFVAKINMGSGKALAVVPHSTRTFDRTPVGGNSAGPSVTVLSMGTDPVQISSISSSTPDFTPDLTCVGALAGGQQCQITITFTPQQSFTRTATLTVTDDDGTSPQHVPLTGFATGNGAVSLSIPNNIVTFGFQPVGTTKSQQFSITNIGTGALTFAGISITENPNDGFTQANDCPVQPSTLPVSGICTVTVGFTPTKPGALNDSLYINTDDPNTPRRVALAATATGQGIGLGIPEGGTSSNTVTAGGAATYTLAIGGAGASGTATLSCAGAPTGATCSLPSNVTVDANTASSFKVTVTTTARANAMFIPTLRRLQWLWAMGLIGLVVIPVRRRRFGRREITVAALLVFLCACGGGTGGGSSGAPGPTPAGTYTLTVKATVGSTSQSVPLTLTVK